MWLCHKRSGVGFHLIMAVPVGTELLSTFHYSPLGWQLLGHTACTSEGFLPEVNHQIQEYTNSMSWPQPLMTLQKEGHHSGFSSCSCVSRCLPPHTLPIACRQLSKTLGFRPMPDLLNSLT